MFPVEAFIFDLDDTIVETEQLNVDLIGAYFREQWHIGSTVKTRRSSSGGAWPDIFEFLIRKYSITATPDEHPARFSKEERAMPEDVRPARGERAR